jgi:exodeoxyribonuclease VII large subunit
MGTFTVSGLSNALGRVIERSFPNVSVEGEVSQVNTPASGHAYIVLQEGSARLSCVVWASQWAGLAFRPKVGQKVVCSGRVGLYAPQGSLQLYVNTVRPVGDGALAAKLEQIKARLDADGLLDPRRKRALPRFPRTVGIATSLTGAALQDFLKVAATRWPARLLVAGCTVQGQDAAASVVRALELLFEDGRSEVIVVTRGGGAKLDLLPFHDETLARWIATAPVPIVSAVGHEIDTSIADLVADAIAATPTAAAVLVLPDALELKRRTDQAHQSLVRSMRRQLQRRAERLAQLEARLRHPQQRIAEAQRRCDDLQDRLERAMSARLAKHRARLTHSDGRLAALSPYGVLDRGYALVTHDGVPLRDPRAVAPGALVHIQVAGGHLDAVVKG